MGAKDTTEDMGVTFNFDNLTAKEMTDFFRFNREQDFVGMSKVFASVITKCPAEWGDPKKPETFADLPYFPKFKPLTALFVQEAQEEAKN